MSKKLKKRIHTIATMNECINNGFIPETGFILGKFV